MSPAVFMSSKASLGVVVQWGIDVLVDGWLPIASVFHISWTPHPLREPSASRGQLRTPPWAPWGPTLPPLILLSVRGCRQACAAPLRGHSIAEELGILISTWDGLDGKPPPRSDSTPCTIVGSRVRGLGIVNCVSSCVTVKGHIDVVCPCSVPPPMAQLKWLTHTLANGMQPNPSGCRGVVVAIASASRGPCGRDSDPNREATTPQHRGTPCKEWSSLDFGPVVLTHSAPAACVTLRIVDQCHGPPILPWQQPPEAGSEAHPLRCHITPRMAWAPNTCIARGMYITLSALPTRGQFPCKAVGRAWFVVATPHAKDRSARRGVKLVH